MAIKVKFLKKLIILKLGKANVVKEGTDVTLVGFGKI